MVLVIFFLCSQTVKLPHYYFLMYLGVEKNDLYLKYQMKRGLLYFLNVMYSSSL